MKINYIYFINVINSDRYKIGITTSTNQRLKTISRIVPFDVEFTKLYEVKNNSPIYVERKLHRYFKDKRVTGEWFRLTPDDLSIIDNLIKTFDNEIPDTSLKKIKWSWGKSLERTRSMKEILKKYKEIQCQYKTGKTINKENINLRKKTGCIRTIIGHQLNMSSGQLGRLMVIERTLSVNEAYNLTFYQEKV